MMEAAKEQHLIFQYVLPSCVPATPFEHAGAVIGAPEMEEPIKRDGILGLGEFMNFPGVIGADDSVLDKLMVAKEEGKIIDGHGPGIVGNDLNAYAAARILKQTMNVLLWKRWKIVLRGMYILLRQGSACHNLRPLFEGRNTGKQQKMSSVF